MIRLVPALHALSVVSDGASTCLQDEVLHPGSVCLLSTASSYLKHQVKVETDPFPPFSSYVVHHSRPFAPGTPEYALRRDLYEKRVQAAKQNNRQEGRLWNAGVNDFSDRTEAELAVLNGWRGTKRSAGAVHLNQVSSHLKDAKPTPSEKSYGHLPSANLVINQGGCGSCWALAAVVALQLGAENAHINRTYSAQELVSCVQNPRHCGGAGGCEGATVELAMQYLMNHGLRTHAQWGYSGTQEDCRTPWSGTPDTHVSSWSTLPSNQYLPLLHAIAHEGPVAVSVAASGWFDYDTGIYHGCSKDAIINHAVTLLGYGQQGDHKYWLIKNSWGLSWGEHGNLRLLRRSDDDIKQCGNDTQPEQGTGCDGGPSVVKVCGMCGILYDSVVPHFKKR